MTDWIVRRWARYGHERLYAETPGGTALGYLDVKTGRLHSDDVTNLPLLQQAIADHQAAQPDASEPPAATRATRERQRVDAGGTAPSVDAAPPACAWEPTPAALRKAPDVGADEVPPEPAAKLPVVPDWDDISATKAGAAARERAIAEKQAAGTFRTGLARLLGVKTDERAWRIGADGEEAVAAQLAKLGAYWRVLHAVRVGERGSDIDHVVIGSTGIFTINTKHHPRTSVWVGGDTFLVNGQRLPYIRNSRHEARRAARLLTEQAGFPVAVVGVIAVMGAHNGFVVKKQPEDGTVVVVQRKRISQHLSSLPPVLAMREIDAIYEVARRSTTWR